MRNNLLTENSVSSTTTLTLSIRRAQSNTLKQIAGWDRKQVNLDRIKKAPGVAKGRWVEELLEALWALISHSTTEKTPYNLIYDTNTMLSVEVASRLYEGILRILTLTMNVCELS